MTHSSYQQELAKALFEHLDRNQHLIEAGVGSVGGKKSDEVAELDPSWEVLGEVDYRNIPVRRGVIGGRMFDKLYGFRPSLKDKLSNLVTENEVADVPILLEDKDKLGKLIINRFPLSEVLRDKLKNKSNHYSEGEDEDLSAVVDDVLEVTTSEGEDDGYHTPKEETNFHGTPEQSKLVPIALAENPEFEILPPDSLNVTDNAAVNIIRLRELLALQSLHAENQQEKES